MSQAHFSEDETRGARSTQVHWRYQIVGGWGEDDYELVDTAMYKADALRIARGYLGPKHYGHTKVIDTMARGGAKVVGEFR